MFQGGGDLKVYLLGDWGPLDPGARIWYTNLAAIILCIKTDGVGILWPSAHGQSQSFRTPLGGCLSCSLWAGER